MTDDVTIEPEAEAEHPGNALKKLREKLKTCQAERQEYLDMSQRLRADYVNLRRQAEVDKAEAIRFASEDIIRELIELADTFELAFANKQAWQAVPENWRQGVEYIYAKLLALFERQGLTPLQALGQVFNPLEHESVMVIDTNKKEEDNLVLAVSQTGYRWHNKVLRPAQVKVGHYVIM